MNNKIRLATLSILVLIGLLTYGLYLSDSQLSTAWYRPFKLGLDLRGGARLVFSADTSRVPSGSEAEAISSLREVIDRRVNVFGVTEPVVQISQSGLGDQTDYRLIVELPGVSDVDEASKMISETPDLEFRLPRPEGPEKEAIIEAYRQAEQNLATTSRGDLSVNLDGLSSSTLALLNQDPYFIPSALTGQYLKKASVKLAQGTGQIGSVIELEFDATGAKLFAELTKAYVGQPIGIYLDGMLISAPVVREEIKNGQAEISGQFTVEEARTLSRNLNLGALPVPISLLSVETISATLGESAIERSWQAGLFAFLVVILFMLVWYRLPGLIASVALFSYVVIMLVLFKMVPVTLTAAGMAGFILTFGLAVDANILIFERMKEELRSGKTVNDAIKDGFARAWLSIRDSNLSTIISSLILFWFGTSFIKGFALTMVIGILVSMFTAIMISRTLLLAMGIRHKNRLVSFLLGEDWQ